MSLRPANAAEIRAWNRWLWKCHKIRTLPGTVVYHCSIDPPMLLIPWKTFEHLVTCVERTHGQLVMSFKLRDDLHTIAEFWPRPTSPSIGFCSRLHVKLLRQSLLKSAEEGYVWWGVEYPPECLATTSYIRWFPKTFPFPPKLKAALQPAPALKPLETSLHLV